jgi:hypothetical protein
MGRKPLLVGSDRVVSSNAANGMLVTLILALLVL